ncbi:hypothetical protein H0176_24670 [Methylorubrum populi]|jgi:hypothetical protein|uniref:Uncharacterized protein n=1 Tax=Methylorubrum rhodesianum TaxID=29427 RepID=A0ABU9ZJA6_9HYPH|nr:hypothetical protein [Methylorubrum rhodesianum]MBK3403875.1 hypothetical protein [Methylorubrum rhodesianum]MBY0143429.1 hypothetical protein [Methylorubrum populi]
MSVGTLAPVPAIMIDSALETHHRFGVAAFATNAVSVFVKTSEKYSANPPVIIQPAARYGDLKGYARRHLVGEFIGFTRANNRDQHPDAVKRASRHIKFRRSRHSGSWALGKNQI